MPMGTQVFREF